MPLDPRHSVICSCFNLLALFDPAGEAPGRGGRDRQRQGVRGQDRHRRGPLPGGKKNKSSVEKFL